MKRFLKKTRRILRGAMHKAILYVGKFFKRGDPILLLLALMATVMGIVAISSATATEGTSKYVKVQFAATLIGVFLFIFLTFIDIDILGGHWVSLLGVSLILIFMLIFLGVDDGTGNKNWIRFLSIGIQPSEFVKIAFIVVIAQHLSRLKREDTLNGMKGLLAPTIIFIVYFGCLVAISKDLGSALIFAFTFVIMLFVSGLKLYWFGIAIAAVAAVTPYVWTNFLEDYQRNRILAPYIPDVVDPNGDGITWQANQSKLALSAGRLTGMGLQQGTQTQSGSVPADQTDFIFAVIGEEMGLIGCCLVILFLSLIIIRCIYIGLRANSMMGAFVCFGVAASLFFQCFENIGMCIGLTPVIGITLPFFSYGGSSIVASYMALGLVSGVRYRPKPERFMQYVY